jgi:hypothetical protein
MSSQALHPLILRMHSAPEHAARFAASSKIMAKPGVFNPPIARVDHRIADVGTVAIRC